MTAKGKSACKQWLDDRAGHKSADCLIWPFSTARGYGHFCLNQKHVYAHRYMCELINGAPPTPAHQAAHSCGNGHKGCVHPQHLSWKTQSENQIDRRLHGTTKRNKNGHPGSLTPAQVLAIRSLGGSKTQDEIAAMFGTTRTNVQLILAGKTKVRIFGLQRQRIKNLLSKADKPLTGPQIAIGAHLVNSSAAVNMLCRMAEDGEVVRSSYGFYTLPRQPPKHP